MKGFNICCVSSAMDGTDDVMLWNGSEEDGNVTSVGMLRVCVREVMALNVKVKTVTVSGKVDRI